MRVRSAVTSVRLIAGHYIKFGAYTVTIEDRSMNRRTLFKGGLGAMLAGASAAAPARWRKSRRRAVDSDRGRQVPRLDPESRKLRHQGFDPARRPGFSHIYLNCFEDFLPQAGIEFYLYDQLGSLFSDNPDDPESLDPRALHR